MAYSGVSYNLVVTVRGFFLTGTSASPLLLHMHKRSLKTVQPANMVIRIHKQFLYLFDEFLYVFLQLINTLFKRRIFLLQIVQPINQTGRTIFIICS